MIDPNKPYEENNMPVSPVGGSNSAPQLDPIPPTKPNIPTNPSVVIPANGGNVPKWFYFVFGLTIIVFFFVTTLIVLQLTQRLPGSGGANPSVTPKVTGSEIPTPTLTSQISSDSAVAKFNKVGISDDVASIEADLKNTDLGMIDSEVSKTDTQASN
ncbi:hypothetical protein HY029_05815 [Candidatus Gottesmanbacteria bacterium]|nr:hypothetical protein [Candidatus Gottesmanbacteria bacterium]